MGYFQEIKRVKGIGFQSGPDNGGDDPFRPIDPFGPNDAKILRQRAGFFLTCSNPFRR